MVHSALQTVVLCLQGSDVGPRPDAYNPTTLSYHLQPTAWLHSAELDTKIYARLTQPRVCGENTKVYPVNHRSRFSFQTGVAAQRCLMHVMLSGFV